MRKDPTRQADIVSFDRAVAHLVREPRSSDFCASQLSSLQIQFVVSLIST